MQTSSSVGFFMSTKPGDSGSKGIDGWEVLRDSHLQGEGVYDYKIKKSKWRLNSAQAKWGNIKMSIRWMGMYMHVSKLMFVNVNGSKECLLYTSADLKIGIQKHHNCSELYFLMLQLH